MIKYILIIYFLFSISLFSQIVSWKKLHGPPGGETESLAIDENEYIPNKPHMSRKEGDVHKYINKLTRSYCTATENLCRAKHA